MCYAELSSRGRIAHLTGRVLTPEKPHQKRMAIIDEHFWHPNRKTSYNEAKSVGFNTTQLQEMSKKWDDLHRRLWDFHSPIWNNKLGALSPITLEQPVGLLNPANFPTPQTRKIQKKKSGLN